MKIVLNLSPNLTERRPVSYNKILICKRLIDTSHQLSSFEPFSVLYRSKFSILGSVLPLLHTDETSKSCDLHSLPSLCYASTSHFPQRAKKLLSSDDCAPDSTKVCLRKRQPGDQDGGWFGDNIWPSRQ